MAPFISAVELVDYYAARIEAYDQQGPCLNAIRAVNARAREVAAALDVERSQGQVRGLLHGIPIIVKDNYETEDMTTTAGSVLLADMRTGRDSTLVAKLRGAGAVILAKSNMHEFAYGITTMGSLFGQTRNPYDLERHPGGSSGGTAAAVAANFAAAGMGSDTCGSIRIPAAFNNLVGLRPTQGLASRFGIVPLSHTQDIGGPITRTVDDAAIVMDACAGFDASDLQTAESVGQVPESYAGAPRNLQHVRLGLLTDIMTIDSEDDAVADVIRGSAEMLASAGAAIVDVSVPNLAELMDDPRHGFLIIRDDFRWDIDDYLASIPDAPIAGFNEILASGKYHPALEGRLRASEKTTVRESAEYLKELARRKDLRHALLAAMQTYELDALVYPSIRRVPALLGDNDQQGSNCRVSAKSGLPAVSLPAGFLTPASGASHDIPVGMELLGPAFRERELLALAAGIENVLVQRRAPHSTPPLTAE
jgi:Asp-tRNA(Asn)/Glu-tRNA(Gln) amidotransferase A subunit family amidase